jgi:hypothetical protein
LINEVNVVGFIRAAFTFINGDYSAACVAVRECVIVGILCRIIDVVIRWRALTASDCRHPLSDLSTWLFDGMRGRA